MRKIPIFPARALGLNACPERTIITSLSGCGWDRRRARRAAEKTKLFNKLNELRGDRLNQRRREDHAVLIVAAAMTKEEEGELRAQLARLQQEHRDLDAAIAALHHSPGSDLIQVQRLKKRKLVLRDRISYIEDQLTPDIIA